MPPPNTLERDLKPGEGADHGQRDAAHLKPGEPKQHDTTQCPTCLKKSERIAKDPDKAGGVWPECDPAILVRPQLVFAVEMGNIEAPNPGMVEAQREAKWPPRVLATERERRPDWSPREVLHKHNPNVLKGTGTCKPVVEPAILKSTAPGHPKMETPHREGEHPWKGPAHPERPHAEATEPQARTASTPEKEKTLQSQNPVSLDGIDYTDAHTPSFAFLIASGHSCSGYPSLCRAQLQGHRRCRQRWSWRTDKALDDAWQVTRHARHVHTRRTTHQMHHAPQNPDASITVPHQYEYNISLQSRTMCEMRGSVGILERRADLP